VRLSGTGKQHKAIRVPEWSEAAVEDGVGQREVVSPEEVQMAPDQRGEVGEVVVANVPAVCRTC